MTLTLEGVSKRVNGRVHIHPTDLTLEAGTMNVLLGPTLSGKTSIMRLMAGLDAPTTGRILWQGQDVTGMRVQDRKVAMVYQQFINYPSMTVYDNIASPLKLMGVDKSEIDRRVQEAAALMQLTPVLLDEPLANLDYKLREELRAEIPRIFEESGAIFVYATTEPEEALLLGGNVATLWEGRITQFGPTAEVYRQPADATTARVFSDPPMNFLAISKTGGRIMFGDGQSAPATGKIAELDDGRYLAGFRPNHLEIGKHETDAMEFKTTLSVTELTGSETFVHLDHHGERWVGLIHGVHNLTLGDELSVWLDPRHVYIFGEDGKLVAPAAYALAA